MNEDVLHAKDFSPFSKCDPHLIILINAFYTIRLYTKIRYNRLL